MENKTKTLEYLNIPKASFYYKSLLEDKDNILKNEIGKVIQNHPSYGHKRISIELKVNKKRVMRVMNKFGIKA